MKVQMLKVVPIKSVKGASFNPPRRTKELRALIRSIGDIGLQYPILVNAQNEIVDGHRRLAACQALGWEEVPVLLTASDRRRAYADVNATAKIMSGNDVLFIYFSDPDALTPARRAKCDRVADAIGRKLLAVIMKRGNSLRVYESATRAAKYCDQVNQKFIVAAIRYILEFGNYCVDAAVYASAPASAIVHAVKSRTELKSTYVEQ